MTEDDEDSVSAADWLTSWAAEGLFVVGFIFAISSLASGKYVELAVAGCLAMVAGFFLWKLRKSDDENLGAMQEDKATSNENDQDLSDN